MSEMVERVAKAIRVRDTTDEFAMARAAIEAMREPTQAMIEAWSVSGPILGEYTDKNCARADWQAMLDAALKG